MLSEGHSYSGKASKEEIVKFAKSSVVEILGPKAPANFKLVVATESVTAKLRYKGAFITLSLEKAHGH